jgi:Fe-S-cluster containining protein
LTVDHDSAIEDWRRNAQQHDGDNYEFLRSLKVRDYGYDPDELAAALHERAFQIVDCTRCANCCKTMGITFDKEDIERIARHLNTPMADFIEAHLEVDQENGQYKTRPKPCPFLGDDNRCTIYDVRPTVCRQYPHTNKEGFTFRTMGVANNALKCPAVFWLVEEMKKQSVPRRRRGRQRRR